MQVRKMEVSVENSNENNEASIGILSGGQSFDKHFDILK